MNNALHKIKTPLSLLKTFFSLLDEKKNNNEEVIDFMLQHIGECKQALYEIEDLVQVLTNKAEENR